MSRMVDPGEIERRAVLKLLGAGIAGTAGATAPVAADSKGGNRDSSSKNNSYDPYPVWDDAQSYSLTSTDGTEIHVDETGNEDGDPILLIHGALQSRLAWDKQMFDGLRDGVEEEYEGLGEEFRLVAMDLRGHGLSGRPEPGDGYGPELSADDVHTVISELDLTNPVLVGWSFGGTIINDYITTYGDDEIRAINFVGSSGGTAIQEEEDDEQEDEEEEESYREIVESTEGFVRSLFYDDLSPRDHYYFLGFNLIVVQGAVSSHGQTNYNDLLSDIEVPTLVSQGEEDVLVSREQAEYLNENISTSRISFYSEVGHSPFWEDPDRFNTELRKLARNPEEYVESANNG